MAGKLRISIMENCPEEFEDELKDFIDDIEAQINACKDLLDIDSISKLAQVEDAFDKLDSLGADLF